MQNETHPQPEKHNTGQQTQPAKPDEKTAGQKAVDKPSLESILKVVSTIIAVGGLILGIITFQAQQRTTLTQNFKMKLWERKLEVYTQLAGVTGDIIIYRNDSAMLDSLGNKFDKIYYSTLILVQNDSVELKVRKYKEAVSDYRQNIKSVFYLKDKQIALMKAIGSALKQTQDFGD